MVASLSYLQAIIMGLVQGITELFPVSSLGHGVLLPAWLGWHNLVSSQTQAQSFFLVFLVGLHVGTALGLLVYYRATWARLLRGVLNQWRAGGPSSLWQLSSPTIDQNYRLLALLVMGAIPVGVVGLILEKPLRELFARPEAAAVFLVINGGVLLVGDRFRARRGRRARHLQVADLTTRGALTIGAAQIFSLFAGISRSGVTMVASMSEGLDHEGAANFSFLLATPVILLAGLYKLPSLFGAVGRGVVLQTLVGAAVAMVCAYVAVAFLTKYFTTKTLRPFAMYCFVLGLVSVVRFF